MLQTLALILATALSNGGTDDPVDCAQFEIYDHRDRLVDSYVQCTAEFGGQVHRWTVR